jgi:hypothetical protein
MTRMDSTPLPLLRALHDTGAEVAREDLIRMHRAVGRVKDLPTPKSLSG